MASPRVKVDSPLNVEQISKSQYNSPTVSDRGDLPDVSDSPRAHVARRFNSLSLRQGRPESPSPSKRIRLTNTSAASSAEDYDATIMPASSSQDPGSYAFEEEPVQDLTNQPNDSSVRMLDGTRLKRMRSPPVPDDAGFTPTWRQTEITGHHIDTAAGDDGEGINGVGFLPTPQTVYARQQKRKQQIRDWKAREAREERQRRHDRRQKAGMVDEPEAAAAKSISNAEVERTVRFEVP